MIRHVLAALLLSLLCPAPGGAQQPVEPVEVPPGLEAALERTDVALNGVRAWPVDWTPHEDLLIQTVYAFIGGNGVAEITWHIVTLTPEGAVFGPPIDLPGAGIESVSPHPDGALLVVYEYRDGDSRCCPSGRSQILLTRTSPR